MIDTTVEAVLPLAQVPELLPRRRRGRKVHLSTLYRWSSCGCRGVVLETIQIGATRCTSREALQRFFEALSTGGRREPAGTAAPSSPSRPLRSAIQRRRAAEEAGRRLEQMGA